MSTILIVDDDPDIAGAFTHVLQSADYDVISAATGQECLQIARAERPDLILLDVRLPDINGLEVCRRIKTDPELARIAVINVTGMRTSKDDEVEGIEAGADAYLTKPVHLRMLLAHVQPLLRARHTETAREIASLAPKWRALGVPTIVLDTAHPGRARRDAPALAAALGARFLRPSLSLSLPMHPPAPW